jgi:geranylgeranyl diphosphate synthase, type II
LTKQELEQVARAILQKLDLPEAYLGWTMVILASEFWRTQVASVPASRRLFLLPHCLKHSQGCPADYDERGLECVKCGACSIADFRETAESMGYQVLVAEGSPLVLKIIVSGHVDAIVGVACLNVLEKAVDKILLAGIPCMAVPLLSSDCQSTSVDEDWVREMIQAFRPLSRSHTGSYVHLMRCASGLFASDELERLVPRVRGGTRLDQINGDGLNGLEPIAGTESIAYDFLQKGGKYSRPFITLAVYDALTGGHATAPDGAQWLARLPDAVKRTAMSIETFHKASLVHDDIEDDDSFRYGEATMHRRFGTATAINVGDYLIGMGYRLVSRETQSLGANVAVDILDCLAEAHTKLSEGQGAELLWRDSRNKRLKPIDALKIYALKTAPAFEAALLSGARLAGSVEPYAQPIKVFARNLGVAFQILNDLNDWRGDQHNKLTTGGDLLAGRPTVLWALALEGLVGPALKELLALVEQVEQPVEVRLQRAWQLYEQAGVFDKANRLIDKHQQRCQEVADKIEPEAFRRLLHYLIAVVLERPD